MRVSFDWIGIKITPLSSSHLSSRIPAIHLNCLKAPPPGRQSNSRESLTDSTKHSTASSLHITACPVLDQISERQDSYIDRCLGQPKPTDLNPLHKTSSRPGLNYDRDYFYPRQLANILNSPPWTKTHSLSFSLHDSLNVYCQVPVSSLQAF